MATEWYANPIQEDQAQSQCDSTILPDSKRVSEIPPFDINPKKIKSRINDLSVEVSLKRNIFTTNGSVQGQMSIKCPKEGTCKLGRILVYLVGIEENLTKTKVKPRLFLSKVWIVQESRLVPSDAVYAGPPDEHGMVLHCLTKWRAREGVTQFDFSIPFGKTGLGHIRSEIESDTPLPSSFWHPQAGGIRYIISAVVESKQDSSPRLPLAAYKELLVVESLPFYLTNHFDGINPMNSHLFVEKTETIKNGLFGIGKKGKISLNGSLRTLSIEGVHETGVWTSGSTCFVGVEIINNNPKRITELDVSLVRIIKTFSFEGNEIAPVSYSKKLITNKNYLYKKAPKNSGLDIRHFKSEVKSWIETNNGTFEFEKSKYVSWEGVLEHEKKKMIVDLNIPPFAQSIRHGSLVDVSFFVVISIVPVGGKKIEIEMPISIYHPSSFLDSLPSLDIDGKASYSQFDQRFNSSESEQETTPSQIVKEQVYSSALTLDLQEPQPRSSDYRRLDKYQSYRPHINGPSPAAVKRHQSYSSEPFDADEVKKLFPPTNAAIKSHQTENDLSQAPTTVDLDAEIDKLNRVVQME